MRQRASETRRARNETIQVWHVFHRAPGWSRQDESNPDNPGTTNKAVNARAQSCHVNRNRPRSACKWVRKPRDLRLHKRQRNEASRQDYTHETERHTRGKNKAARLKENKEECVLCMCTNYRWRCEACEQRRLIYVHKDGLDFYISALKDSFNQIIRFPMILLIMFIRHFLSILS